MSDSRPVAVVTGASRGAGAGIAHALGSHGCTVYVTGRTRKAGESALPGTIDETAERVTAAGGKGIAVRVDHGDDEQVKALFDQVEREHGQDRHPGQQRRDHPRRDDGADQVLGRTRSTSSTPSTSGFAAATSPPCTQRR